MKRLLFVVMTLALVVSMVACAAPATPAAKAPAGKTVKIGLSMDSLESAFWVANHAAMQAKAKEMGVEMVEVMAEGDPNKQNQQVENLIAQGVTALIIAPKDGAAIVASIKKAKDAGIPVIMDNRPVQGDVRPDLQILSDNYTMAKQALQWFVDKAKKDGKTYKALLLVGNLGDENAVERKKGHMEILNANKDVIEVVAEVPTEWKHEVALAGMQNAFQAHPDINLVITPSDFLFPPIKSVLEQNNSWKKIGEPGHIAIVSFDGDEVGMQYLNDGYNWVDAAQAADNTGFLAVEWAVKLTNGQKPDQDVIRDPGIIANIDNCKEVCPKVWGWSKVVTGAAPAPVGKTVKIGLSMDSLESAFWVANHAAMVAKAKEMGVEMVVVMAEGDPNKQNQQVENLIAQGVTALIIAPKDGAAIVASIKKAKEAGIPVIMDNRPVQGDVLPDLQILSDNYVMAKQALQWFVDKAKKDGKTYKALLLVGNLGDENAVERKKGHMEILNANKDVIEVVAEVPTEWKHEVALAGMQNAFQAHPDINLIITPSDFLFPPIKSVLEQNNSWKKIGEPGHIAIVSFDGDEVGMQYLKDGYNWVDAAQAADNTGFLAVEWAVKLSNGQKPDSNIFRDPGVIANIDNCSVVCPTVWGWSKVK